MIREIVIENFRGIRKGEIKDLSKINVFIGRNNVGKSSILEAIYYVSALFNNDDIIYGSKINWLLERRGRKRGSESLHYLYSFENKIMIRLLIYDNILQIVEQKRLLELPKNLAQNDFIFYDLSIERLTDKDFKKLKHPPSNIIEYSQKVSRKISKLFNETFFVDSSLIRNFEVLERTLWKDIVRERKDKELVKLVREGFSLDVEDFSFLPSLGGNEYCLIAKLPNYSIDIDDLGDGVRHALAIAMILLRMGNEGILLIEEPETHQHPGGLYNVLLFIGKLIRNRNIQVFISTHSIEVVRYLEDISQKENIDFSVFFIERDKEGRLSYRKVSRIDRKILEDLGIDVRFLDII